jgi:nucleoside-diphosphate-sugar epimerase
MTTTPPPDAPTLELLVLGGTSWLGGALARQAVARGHRVTCLARGESGEPPAGVTWVRADRNEPTAYDEVRGRAWDSVLDVSWQPDQVRSALAALAPDARHWVYVSSGSVYADDDVPDTGEDAPLHEPHRDPGPVTIEQYGPAKVACELACLDAMGANRVFAARAGLIAGYGDRSDRLGYWPARVARAEDGEPVLVPPESAPVQVIDVEDLAEWLVRVAEEQVAGVVNAVGDTTTVADVLAACVEASGRTPRLVAADDDWLAEQGVAPWAGEQSLPLWLPQPAYAGFMTRRNEAAHRAGLRLRPVLDTVAAALAWERECGLDRPRRAGLTPEREAELVERWAEDSATQQ